MKLSRLTFTLSHATGACGTIIGYNEEVDRYIIALTSGARVRARRGNIMMSEASACDVVSHLQAITAIDDITTLRAVYGEHTTTSLVKILLSIPNRAWTVADDLWLISEFWRVEAGAAAAASPPLLHPRGMLTARQLHADRRGRKALR
jgi:hypothetical protein|eukprot:2216038-Prymnesium_polylepis.1